MTYWTEDHFECEACGRIIDLDFYAVMKTCPSCGLSLKRAKFVRGMKEQLPEEAPVDETSIDNDFVEDVDKDMDEEPRFYRKLNKNGTVQKIVHVKKENEWTTFCGRRMVGKWQEVPMEDVEMKDICAKCAKVYKGE